MTLARSLRVALLASALAVSACATDAGVTDTTGLDTGDLLSPDATQSSSLTGDSEGGIDVETLQRDLQSFSDSVANSDSAADLQAAWSDVESAVGGALSSMDAESAQTAREALDEFGNEIPDSEPELRSAWEQLRSQVEATIDQFGSVG